MDMLKDLTPEERSMLKGSGQEHRAEPAAARKKNKSAPHARIRRRPAIS